VFSLVGSDVGVPTSDVRVLGSVSIRLGGLEDSYVGLRWGVSEDERGVRRRWLEVARNGMCTNSPSISSFRFPRQSPAYQE